MIFLHDIYIVTQEDLDMFFTKFDEMYSGEGDKNLAEGVNLYKEYLQNIFDLSLKLQESVTQNISDDLDTCVIIPFRETDDFDLLNFVIAAEDDRKIRKREMILFESYCDKYFKSTIGLMSLFSMHFDT